MKKLIKKSVDGTLGTLLRAFVRYCLVHPLILINYRVTINGAKDAESCTNGAIIAATHASFMDGPFLTSVAWVLARIRSVVWHAEYSHPFQYPIMKLFGAISVGSPKHLPKEERLRRKEKAKEIMDKVLDAGRSLLIFPEGGIGDGDSVTIAPHLSGLHDLILAHPDKPLLLLRLDGFQYSIFGKRPLYRWFTRLPISITIERFDNVSLEGGPAGLNARLERYFNDHIPLATTHSRRKESCLVCDG